MYFDRRSWSSCSRALPTGWYGTGDPRGFDLVGAIVVEKANRIVLVGKCR
jgi:hypothetical protein